MLLSEIGGVDYHDSESSTQKLECKLLQHYKEKRKIEKGKTKRGNLVFSSEISNEEALRKEHSMKSRLNGKIREVAYVLRSEILNSEKSRCQKN